MEYIHENISCDICHTPVVGIRYKCANCADFDLCEICESRSPHEPTHVFLRIKQPLPEIIQRVLIPFSLYNVPPLIAQTPILASPLFQSTQSLKLSSQSIKSSRSLQAQSEPQQPPMVSPKFPTLPLVPFFGSSPSTPSTPSSPALAMSGHSGPSGSSAPSPLLRFFPSLRGSGGIKEKDLARTINEFGFRVIHTIQQKNTRYHENVIVSPFGLNMCLMVAANGAADETCQEIIRVLGHSNLDMQTLNMTLKGHRNVLSSNEPDLCIVNSMWTSQTMPVKPTFAQTMKEIYNGEISVPSKEDPSKWISSKTDNRITDLTLPADLLSLWLIGVTCFKCKWRKMFEKHADGSFDFGRVTCGYMKGHGDFQFYEDSDGMQAVAIPHIANTRAVVILPPEPQTASGLLTTMDAAHWTQILSSLRHKSGTVIMPKFKVESSFALKGVLNSLGIQRAFTNNAQFANVAATPVWLSEVMHKTQIECDETGIESLHSSTGTKNTFTMEVTRPFVFAVCDAANMILFMGVINTPQF